MHAIVVAIHVNIYAARIIIRDFNWDCQQTCVLQRDRIDKIKKWATERKLVRQELFECMFFDQICIVGHSRDSMLSNAGFASTTRRSWSIG